MIICCPSGQTLIRPMCHIQFCSHTFLLLRTMIILCIVSTLNNFAPIKVKISKTPNKKLWITAGLLKSCKYRQKLFIKALHGKIPCCFSLLNEITFLIVLYT